MDDVGLAPNLAAPQHGPRPLPLFLSMLRSETAASPERRAAALAGLKAYQSASRVARHPPMSEVAQSGRACLRDYGGDGAPVVFQHGLCGDARQTFEALPAGLRCVTLNCRGHGASDAVGVFSIAAFAQDVAALIGTELRAPVVLGGISMGAAIACRLAATQPGLVRALILVRPAWVCDAAPPNMAANREVGRLLARLPAAAARAAFASSARDLPPDNRASLDGFFDRQPQAVTAALLQAIAADGPGIGESALAALRVPALICASAEDAIHPAAHAERLAALIPGARLIDLPPKGRGKPAHLAALHTAITAFMTELADA